MTHAARDHGGGVDSAAVQYGGNRTDWIDLSTGINPLPYPLPDLPAHCWNTLPDLNAQNALTDAARAFWQVPSGAAILAAPGASSLIARIPALAAAGRVDIPAPTYNEHAAAFTNSGWEVNEIRPTARVLVHPNNPTGRLWQMDDLTAPLMVIDESFCDVTPEHSLITAATRPGTLILKSFGKFWGLAGLRLGFAIGDPALIDRLATMLGPWPVSGPALYIGAQALRDHQWASATRQHLATDSARLDTLMASTGAKSKGGTTLFRLYDVPDAAALQSHLAQHQIWTRIFPYSPTLIRLGLPTPTQWPRIEAALAK